MKTVSAGVAACIAITVMTTAAQQPATFDAVSVKRNRSGGFNAPAGFVAIRGNRLTAPYVTAADLIRTAYGVDREQVIGGPAWIRADAFEVTATTTGPTTVEAGRRMLQALLLERFNLGTHHETRPLPVYELRHARADRQLGKGLRVGDPDCAPMRPPKDVPPPPPPPPGDSGPPPVLLDRPRLFPCPSMLGAGFVSGRNMPMSTLVWSLRQWLTRPVIDRTGLEGGYDIDLIYTPEVPVGFGATPPPSLSDAPSIFTALQEQLGLKLESTRAPLDVIVVDRISAPTEN
jgi:uncharacterized protein (TIGR03435 family)